MFRYNFVKYSLKYIDSCDINFLYKNEQLYICCSFHENV